MCFPSGDQVEAYLSPVPAVNRLRVPEARSMIQMSDVPVRRSTMDTPAFVPSGEISRIPPLKYSAGSPTVPRTRPSRSTQRRSEVVDPVRSGRRGCRSRKP